MRSRIFRPFSMRTYLHISREVVNKVYLDSLLLSLEWI